MATTIRENLHASKRACCFALQNFVIPTGAKRYPRRAPFFARWGIGAEWRGLLFSPSTLCHPDRSEAERRDLRSLPSTLCHPDRSEAEWRDLLLATRKDAGHPPFVIPNRSGILRRSIAASTNAVSADRSSTPSSTHQSSSTNNQARRAASHLAQDGAKRNPG
jgi:hypothetical protein